MAIREQWDRLDPATRKWLTDNPRCLLLPHAITAAISKESGEAIECDNNGQMVLTPEDRDFLRIKANETSVGPQEYLPGNQS
jgi:hypothetical protein